MARLCLLNRTYVYVYKKQFWNIKRTEITARQIFFAQNNAFRLESLCQMRQTYLIKNTSLPNIKKMSKVVWEHASLDVKLTAGYSQNPVIKPILHVYDLLKEERSMRSINDIRISDFLPLNKKKKRLLESTQLFHLENKISDWRARYTWHKNNKIIKKILVPESKSPNVLQLNVDPF